MGEEKYRNLWKRPQNPRLSPGNPLSEDLRNWWRERLKYFHRTTLRLLSQFQSEYQNRVIPKEARASTGTKGMTHRTVEEVQDLWHWDEESVITTDQDETQEFDVTSI